MDGTRQAFDCLRLATDVARSPGHSLLRQALADSPVLPTRHSLAAPQDASPAFSSSSDSSLSSQSSCSTSESEEDNTTPWTVFLDSKTGNPYFFNRVSRQVRAGTNGAGRVYLSVACVKSQPPLLDV